MSSISRATPEFTVHHLDNARSCSGIAFSKEDGTDYVVNPDDTGSINHRRANMTLYLTRGGPPRCTAAWMIGSQNPGSGVLNTNAGPRIPDHVHLDDRCLTLARPDGTIHTVIYVNEIREMINPDRSNMAPGHTKAFEIPLMIIAQNLNIKPPWLTPSVSASSQTGTGGPTEGDEASEMRGLSTSGSSGPDGSLADIPSDTQATEN